MKGKRKNAVIGTINGHNITFDEKHEVFECKIGEYTFSSPSIKRLRLDVDESLVSELDLKCLYCGSGEIIPIKIVRMDSRGILYPSSNKVGFGVPYSVGPEDIYPATAKNLQLQKTHKELREKGWELIRRADAFGKLLEPFPKNYFKTLRDGGGSPSK